MKDKTDKPEEIKTKDVKTETKEEIINTEEIKKERHEDCKCDEKECENCEEQLKVGEEYKMKYLRAIADYQNYERRVQDQRIEWTKNANKKVILKLLSFLDDLERAELFVKDPNLIHVKETFAKMLKSEGLEEIEVLGKSYSPYTAEVVDMKEGKEDGRVLAVLRKGYTYNGQLLRVAQVTVEKKAVNNKL